MAEQQGQPLVSTTRQGTKDTGSEDTGKFPFEGWEFTLPQDVDPRVILRAPWKIAAAAWVTGTAATLATKNAIVPLGAIAYETNTLFFKIGDGVTAYNTLSYQPQFGKVAPLPYWAVGVGQWPASFTANYPANLTLPAGGAWVGAYVTFNNVSYLLSGMTTFGPTAGGSVLTALGANQTAQGFCWRVA